MLAKFDLKGVHTTIDESLDKYTKRKIGNLDKYLPRAHRDSAHAVVELKEAPRAKDQNRFTCGVTLYLPHETIEVRETTLNIYAAIDIVEEKLKQRIKKYKDQHADGKIFRHLAGRLRRRTGLRPEQISSAD